MSNADQKPDNSVHREVYEHLHRVFQLDEAAYEVFLEKVNRLMTVQGMVFAAMAFALTSLQDATLPGSVGWFLTTCGLVASLVLAAALYCAVKCQEPDDVPAVGVRLLEPLLAEDKLSQLNQDELYRDFSRNVVSVIMGRRDKEPVRRRWATRMKRLTLTGFVFGAIFVALAIGATVLYPTKKEKPMPPKDSTGVSQTPAQPDTVPSPHAEPSPVSQAPPRPSVVEPPEMITRSNPTRPSVVEAYETVTGSDDGRSRENRINGKHA